MDAASLSTTRRSPNITADRSLRCRHPGASSWRFIIDPSNPRRGMLSWARPPCQRLGGHRGSPRSPTVTANWPLRWRSSWRFILIDSNPERCTLSRARPPCQQRRPVGAGERSSRRRQGTPAVSRRMSGDLHPWLHPWRHGWHAASRPRQDVGGWERLLLFSGGAPGTCPTRSTSAGLGMGVSWPVSSKRRLAS